MPPAVGIPQRVQLRRTPGWRKPENTISVARPSKFGNPFVVGKTQIRLPALDGSDWEHEGRLHKTPGERHPYVRHIDGRDVITWHQVETATAAQCVEMYREYITGRTGRLDYRHPDLTAVIRTELAGRNLACWCPLVDEDGQPFPCHADVLLAIANATGER